MRVTRILPALAGVLVAAGMLIAQPAQAQFSIQLGGSDAEVKRSMLQQGFSEIKILKRKLTSTRLEACKDGKRYFIKMRFVGAIEEQRQIGTCAVQLTSNQIVEQLQKKGYRRINVEEINGEYVVISCFNNDRIRTRINKTGVVRDNRKLGVCREALSPTDVATKLEEAGYDRVVFTDRQLPKYVAEACRKGRKFELELNRVGEIRNERRIGRCEQAYGSNDLAGVLAERGYDRVKVVDDRSLPYLVEACRDLRRVELDIGRYGRISNETQIGSCNPPLKRADIASNAREQGLTRIKFTTIPGTDYLMEACQSAEKVRIRFDQYGDVLKQTALGRCDPLSMQEVRSELEGRGFTKLKTFVEGCTRRNRKVRIQIDEYGEAVSRERIGRC